MRVALTITLIILGCDTGPPVPPDASPRPSGDVDAAVFTPCFDQTECSVGEFCQIPEGAFSGECRPGCDADDDCEGDTVCDVARYTCVPRPCVDDGECPNGYCDPDAAACLPSGCSSTRPCPQIDDRVWICEPRTHDCWPLLPCCAPDGTCSLAVEGLCPEDAQQLPAESTCAPNPCERRCARDRDCPLGQYCAPGAARCRDGCRLDRQDACEIWQYCHDETRTCVDRPGCQSDDDCPPPLEGCDLATGGCRLPCSMKTQCSCVADEDCPSDMICDADFVCAPRPCVNDADCPPIARCERDTGLCVDFECSEDADCPFEERCDFNAGLCVADGCVDDLLEENDSLDAATDLDRLPGLAVDGAVPYDADGLAVPAALAACAGDVDMYCLTVSEGDRLEAEAVIDAGAHRLELAWMGPGDRAVGSIGHALQAETTPARLDNARVGRQCVRVTGDRRDAGAYRLVIRRVALADFCAADPDPGEAHDRAAPMLDVGAADGVPDRRFVAEGLICGVEDDWYRFPVATPDARVCVTLDGFRHRAADLNLELFVADPAVPRVGASMSVWDVESIDIPKGAAAQGEHVVRVSREIGADTPYRLTATVTPPDAVWPPDWREGGGNDHPDQAVHFGAEHLAMCDTWLCGEQDFDYFTIIVPAGEDRTIGLAHDPEHDGRAFLDVLGAERDGVPDFGGMRRADEPLGSVQCVNLRGGERDQMVTLRVFGAGMWAGDDERLDYALYVIPTDLAGLDPADPNARFEYRGGCLLLGAADLPSCPLRDPFADGCWPVMALE